ncbi:MAG: type VI secretion system domain-containing protein, partial [Myxococcota bacterium]|nr:type VI secretion system domain-containing protein [Myxococcota bacterium]
SSPAHAPPPAPALPPPPDAPQDLSRVPQFLAHLGASLCTTAASLRTSRAHDAEGLRLLLAGLYLPVVQVPPRARERRTGLPGPATAMRADVDRFRREGDPVRLLEVATRALEKHRFWLDLHLAVSEALTAIGASALEGRDLHANEIRSLVARLPGLLDAEFSDGTPFVAAETRTWLDTLAGAPGHASSAASAESPIDLAMRDARELLRAGKTADALTRAQCAVRLATTVRERFVARIELAALALDAKVPAVALALSAELHRESITRDLAAWDAPLAARACGLYLRAAATERNTALLPVPHAEVYAHLCLLDPAAAASLARA